MNRKAKIDEGSYLDDCPALDLCSRSQLNQFLRHLLAQRVSNDERSLDQRKMRLEDELKSVLSRARKFEFARVFWGGRSSVRMVFLIAERVLPKREMVQFFLLWATTMAVPRQTSYSFSMWPGELIILWYSSEIVVPVKSWNRLFRKVPRVWSWEGSKKKDEKKNLKDVDVSDGVKMYVKVLQFFTRISSTNNHISFSTSIDRLSVDRTQNIVAFPRPSLVDIPVIDTENTKYSSCETGQFFGRQTSLIASLNSRYNSPIRRLHNSLVHIP